MASFWENLQVDGDELKMYVKAARDPATQEGGSDSDDRLATTLQQGAHHSSIQHRISRLLHCPIFAGC